MASKLILTKYLISSNLLRQSIFMSAEHFVENWNFDKYCRESLYINSVLRRFPGCHAMDSRFRRERDVIYGVSIKSLYNFKNLLPRQMKRQASGNY